MVGYRASRQIHSEIAQLAKAANRGKGQQLEEIYKEWKAFKSGTGTAKNPHEQLMALGRLGAPTTREAIEKAEKATMQRLQELREMKKNASPQNRKQ